MAQLGVRQAAQHVGVTRQTINRHIRQGKLSATRDREGVQRIDSEELLRVYGEIKPVPAPPTGTSPSKLQAGPEQATVVLQVEIERLKAKLDAAEAMLAVAQERIADGRSDRDKLMEILDRQSRMLTGPAPSRPPKKPKKK